MITVVVVARAQGSGRSEPRDSPVGKKNSFLNEGSSLKFTSNEIMVFLRRTTLQFDEQNGLRKISVVCKLLPTTKK